MSAIAHAWVATLTVGNQTAKQLLQFYASHNFGKPGFEFKNCTLAKQLEVSERAIQNAHKLLQEKKLIRRIPQYGKDGSQKNTLTYLEIPQEFIDAFFGEHKPVDKRGGEGEVAAGGGGTTFAPRGELGSTLNNKFNINLNKSFCATHTEKEMNRQQSLNKQNERNDKPKPPIAPVTSQSTCFNENYLDVPLAPMSPLLEEHMKKQAANG